MPEQPIADVEREIDDYITACRQTREAQTLLAEEPLCVIKYVPASYLTTILATGQLYASERAGFTWGDAIYAAPLKTPRTTMMYGHVGIVGTYPTAYCRIFDADNSTGIRLYQEWITHQTTAYRELTTTIHAPSANRDLRNAFRTRFQIDLIIFRPDEPCPDYVDPATDWWLAVTHWDAYRAVGHGYSRAIENLKWCVVTPDAFAALGKGYQAFLHATLSATRTYQRGTYTTLSNDIAIAYAKAAPHVVICDFK
jgi:hypothetical protein